MLRLLTLMTLAAGALVSGCATTQGVIQSIPIPGTSSDTPLEQVLKKRPELRNNLVTVELRQFFNNAESPTAGQVKLTETGLLDDSIRSIQTVYHFKLNERKWDLISTENMYQCRRGKDTRKFQKQPCP